MSGTVNVARALFEDEDFANESYSEREAWLWLIMQARWKAGKKHIGHTVIDLDRGQVAASVRYLAEAWQWSKSRVDRFLKRLIDRDKIRVTCGTVASTITICNYEKYQGSAEDGGTPAGQARDTCGTKKKKGERRGKEVSVSPAGAEPAGFSQFWEIYPHRAGTRRGRKVALEKFAKAVRSGVTPNVIIEAAKRYSMDRSVVDGYAKNPETWLNQECWNDEIEAVRLGATGTAINAVNGHTQRTQPQRARAERAAFSHAIDQLAADLSAGTVKLDTSRSDPFAKRAR